MSKIKLLLVIPLILSFFIALPVLTTAKTNPNTKILTLADTCTSGQDFKTCAVNNIPNTPYGSYKKGVDSSTLATLFGNIVSIILGFVGLIFFAMMFYSGYQWFISGSSAEDRKKAGTRIKNSIIGLAITMTAYGLSYYVFSRFDFLRSGNYNQNTATSCSSMTDESNCNKAGDSCLWNSSNAKCTALPGCSDGTKCNNCFNQDCTGSCVLNNNLCLSVNEVGNTTDCSILNDDPVGCAKFNNCLFYQNNCLSIKNIECGWFNNQADCNSYGNINCNWSDGECKKIGQ